MLAAEEAMALLDAIDVSTLMGLRVHALSSLMVYTYSRVGAAIGMHIEDVQGRRTWVRLQEKGGKQHEIPCHHNLDKYPNTYIEAWQSTESEAFLLRSAVGRTRTLAVNTPMGQADVYRMIGRRALNVDVQTRIGCHSLRATGITEYLRNGGKLEVAQQMANYETVRTIGL